MSYSTARSEAAYLAAQDVIAGGVAGSMLVTLQTHKNFSAAANLVDAGMVVFAHGKTFHDGGWFDARADKPRIQIQRLKGGPWETIGEIAAYPATTATDSVGVTDGLRQSFAVRLKDRVKAIAVRVIGQPACGDNPPQAVSSCAELQAFAE